MEENYLRNGFTTKMKEMKEIAIKYLENYEGSDGKLHNERSIISKQIIISALMSLAPLANKGNLLLQACKESVEELIQKYSEYIEKNVFFDQKVEKLNGSKILGDIYMTMLENELIQSEDEDILIGIIFTIQVLAIHKVELSKNIINRLREIAFNSDTLGKNKILKNLSLRCSSYFYRYSDLKFKFEENEIKALHNIFFNDEDMKCASTFALALMTENIEICHPKNILDECLKIIVEKRETLNSYNVLVVLFNCHLYDYTKFTEDMFNTLLDDFDNQDSLNKNLIIRLIASWARNLKLPEKATDIILKDINCENGKHFNLKYAIDAIGLEIKNFNFKGSDEMLKKLEKQLDDPEVPSITVTYIIACILSQDETLHLSEDSLMKIARIIQISASNDLNLHCLCCLFNAVNNLQILNEDIINILLPLFGNSDQDIIQYVEDIIEKNTQNLSIFN